MPKQEGQKSKLLALLHIFEQQTDESIANASAGGAAARQGIPASKERLIAYTDAPNALGYDDRLRRTQRRLLDGDAAFRAGGAEASGGRCPVQPGHLESVQ